MALPTLIAPLLKRYEREKAVAVMVKKMYGTATPVASAITDHLSDETCAFLHEHLDNIDKTWCDMKIGGMAGGTENIHVMGRTPCHYPRTETYAQRRS